MLLKDIIQYLEKLAPISLQEEYDNSGLIIGNPESEIKKSLITLDITEEVIFEAIHNNCNLIIAHHPLIFKGLKKITGKTYVERCVQLSIKHEIAIYAIHTNLDNIIDGVNSSLAAKLNLTNIRVLQPKESIYLKLNTYVPIQYLEQVQQALFEAGAGNIGAYSECSFISNGNGTFKPMEGSQAFVGDIGIRHQEPESELSVIVPLYLKNQVEAALKSSHPYEEVAFDWIQLLNTTPLVGSGMIGSLPQPMSTEEWLAYLKEKLNLDTFKYTKSYQGEIKDIALCGGSGSFLLNQAKSNRADVFVSSDFKYHEFFEAEKRIMVCDIGHYESEIFTNELLMKNLTKKFPTFAAQISAINTNPIKYYK